MCTGLRELNLQRADRVTMAHGLEARVPFLELDMISLGLSLPAGWKLAGEDQPEKRLLRQAFEGRLPDDFLWRKKAQVGDGSGAASVLQDRTEGPPSPRRSSSASAATSSRRCAPAKRWPTTASSPKSWARFGPSARSAASPRPEPTVGASRLNERLPLLARPGAHRNKTSAFRGSPDSWGPPHRRPRARSGRQLEGCVRCGVFRGFGGLPRSLTGGPPFGRASASGAAGA